jgi:cell division protein FtsL
MISKINATGIYSWQQNTKRKTKIEIRSIKGFSSSVVLIAALIFVVAGSYLYSINSSAIKGSQIRKVEKEIQELRKENDNLKIREAELKSLYHIEESSKNLNMGDVKSVSYIEQSGPVAMAK